MPKSLNPGFRPSDYWMTCDRCGHEYRQSRMKKEWNGLIVCKDCWESRQPQDFVRSRHEKIATPANFTRPQGAEDFTFTQCSNIGSIAGEAVAGCAIAGTSSTYYKVPSGTFGSGL